MGNPRYIQTDQQSFYGGYLYDQIVPENHFLRKLNALVDWSYYTKKLTKLYKGEGLAGNNRRVDWHQKAKQIQQIQYSQPTTQGVVLVG